MDVSKQLKIAEKIKEIQNSIRKKNRKLKAERGLFEENKIKPFVEALAKSQKQHLFVDKENESAPQIKFYKEEEDSSNSKEIEDRKGKRKADETIVSYTPMRGKEKKKSRVEEAIISDEDGDEELFEDVEMREEDPREGPLTSEYMRKLFSEKSHDTARGPYYQDDSLMLGNKLLEFDEADNIILGRETKFPGTRGLFELIFMTQPASKNYTKEDLENYKKVLILSSAHLIGNNPLNRIKGSTGHKYLNIISPLFRDQSGTGAQEYKLMEKIQFVHYNDPNKLVDRLRLLKASEAAGNSSHKPEIDAIIEELKETGYIKLKS